MSESEFIERVMTLHWDMAACRCHFCEAARPLGYRPRRDYLHDGNSSELRAFASGVYDRTYQPEKP